MPFSHHSHSGQYCSHGHGDLAAVVEGAIARGFHTYALTEHMPRQRQQDLYPDEIGQTPSDLASKFASFVKEARQLQEQTSGIRLLVGCETEWITADEFAGSIKALVDEYALDFVVGSVHHVHEIPIDYSRELFDKALAMHAGDFNGLFAAFYDAQFEMLQAVKPAVVGHVDLIKMYVPSQPYSEDVLGRIDRNVAFAVSYGALFELNSRAFKKGIPSPYPMPDVLSRIVAQGGRFTLSDDCHGPNDVGMHYDKLATFIQEKNLANSIYYLRRTEDGSVEAVHEPNILNHPFFLQCNIK